VTQYDVVVIGSGPGGYVAAIHASQSGLETAIVEKEPTERLGGTCLLRGCIPTKAMLHTADMLDEMEKSEEIGITGGDFELSMDKMHDYKAKVVQKNAGGVQYLMKKNDIDVHFGHGRIGDDKNVSVEDDDGNTTTLETDNIILATGSGCLHLPFIDMEPDRVMDSDDILQMEEVPEHLVVIGAGAVGTEFGSVFLRYGSDVTLVEMQDRVLPAEDAEVSEEAKNCFERQGMDVMVSSKVTDVDAGDDGVELVIETETDGETSSKTVNASHLLVAAGRQPQTDDIGADDFNIDIDDRGVIDVDDMMQTGEEGIYAIGDITGSIWLAHLASHEGIVAVDHITDQNPRPIDYDLVPMCTYCDPEVASVGLSEEEARERGYDVQTGKFPFSAIGKAAILNKTDGFVKIVSETKYDEVLGVHIIGAKATELITEGTLAMELESTVAELIDTIHPHPTLSETIGEAAHATLGEAIHV